MTRFDKLISQKIKTKFNEEYYINDNSKECIIDNNSIESDIEKNYLKKNILSSSFSSVDSHINVCQNNQINNNNKDIIEDEKNKFKDLDIDDLVKLIDSDENTVQKKKKKKKNKNKKNKNKINNNIVNFEEKKNENIFQKKEEDKIKDFEVLFNDFKNNINQSSLNFYITQKIKPKLTIDFLIKLYTKK